MEKYLAIKCRGLKTGMPCQDCQLATNPQRCGCRGAWVFGKTSYSEEEARASSDPMLQHFVRSADSPEAPAADDSWGINKWVSEAPHIGDQFIKEFGPVKFFLHRKDWESEDKDRIKAVVAHEPLPECAEYTFPGQVYEKAVAHLEHELAEYFERHLRTDKRLPTAAEVENAIKCHGGVPKFDPSRTRSTGYSPREDSCFGGFTSFGD